MASKKKQTSKSDSREEEIPTSQLRKRLTPNTAKEKTVAEIQELLSKTQAAILTEYRGLTVAEISELRRKLRGVGAEYHVVKNTLFRRAWTGNVTPELDTLLNGPTAVVFMTADLVGATKTILDFVKDTKKSDVKIKGGFFGTSILSVEDVSQLTKLPTKEQVIAELLGSITGPLSGVVGALNAPATDFVGCLSAITSDFVYTLQAIVDKQGEQAPAA